MRSIIPKLLKKDRITDSILGVLAWDREICQWVSVSAPRSAKQLKLYVATPHEEQVQPVQKGAEDKTITDESRQAYSRFIQHEQFIYQSVAEAALSLYRDWNSQPIEAAALQSKLKLEALTLYPRGEMELAFDDGGAFWGHQLIAHVGPDGSVSNVTLYG